MGSKKRKRKKKTEKSNDNKKTEKSGANAQPVETIESVAIKTTETVPAKKTENFIPTETSKENFIEELYSRKEKGFYGPRSTSLYKFVIFCVFLFCLLIFYSFVWGGVGNSFVEFESLIFLGVFFGWLIVSAFTFRGFTKQREAPILLMALSFLSLSFFILVESMTVSDPVFNVFEGLSDSDVAGIKALLGVLSVFCALSALKISLSRH